MLQPGAKLRRGYTIQRVIGQGGMGTVYLARHTKLKNKKVAIKSMVSQIDDPSAYATAVTQFEKEAEILASIEHPGVVDIRDYFEEDGVHYLVEEFIPGVTMAAVIEQVPQHLPMHEVLDWMDQLCDVLHFLHTYQPPIIVRDLKPDNVMLDANKKVHLIDFGIARVFDPGSKTENILKGTGTIGYAPVEQYGAGTTDARSDIYALGATLYAALTTRVAPWSVDLATGEEELTPPSVYNPYISKELEAIILKTMAVRKDDRYQTAAEVRHALREARNTVDNLPPIAVAISSKYCTSCGATTVPRMDACPSCSEPYEEVVSGVPIRFVDLDDTRSAPTPGAAEPQRPSLELKIPKKAKSEPANMGPVRPIMPTPPPPPPPVPPPPVGGAPKKPSSAAIAAAAAAALSGAEEGFTSPPPPPPPPLRPPTSTPSRPSFTSTTRPPLEAPPPLVDEAGRSEASESTMVRTPPPPPPPPPLRPSRPLFDDPPTEKLDIPTQMPMPIAQPRKQVLPQADEDAETTEVVFGGDEGGGSDAKGGGERADAKPVLMLVVAVVAVIGIVLVLGKLRKPKVEPSPSPAVVVTQTPLATPTVAVVIASPVVVASASPTAAASVAPSLAVSATPSAVSSPAAASPSAAASVVAGTTGVTASPSAASPAASPSASPSAAAGALPKPLSDGFNEGVATTLQSTVLTPKDLEGYSDHDLGLLRWGIYAFHGMKFEDGPVNDYFESRPWYHINPGYNTKNIDSLLNATELKNGSFIVAYQKEHHMQSW